MNELTIIFGEIPNAGLHFVWRQHIIYQFLANTLYPIASAMALFKTYEP